MLEALSVDAAASDALFGRPFRGRVHSVFAKTVNFTGPRGQLHCLAAEELDDAPGTIRVRHSEGLRLDSLGIKPGDEVATFGGGLAFGAVPLVAREVRPWSASLPAFPSVPAGRNLLAARLVVLKNEIVAAGYDGGLKAFIGGTVGTVMENRLAERAAALISTLVDGDLSDALAAGRRLIGLGTGLTPSGDDFLAGLMITFNMPAGPFGRRYREVAKKLAAGAETGTVSRAMLQYAARGRTRDGVVALLAAMTDPAARDIVAAVRRVLACGATSGTDLAAGIAAGLSTGLELAGEREE
ncbi:DUF2877 domain-containing protein [Anaeroselena agilis]|uniref:DUF2877 domain-containing protein n=1 Tax=Anaeroselena agilis TaxID=3063788 RepID=A0ABU3NUL5_9FIRM|nr:DUF2877 domain-containing protein [Selenomonadales bacterium 4137-cl]